MEKLIPLIPFVIITGIVSIIGFFILRYLDGCYSISSTEILEEGTVVDKYDRIKSQYYIIKQTYVNGRIKIKRIEL